MVLKYRERSRGKSEAAKEDKRNSKKVSDETMTIQQKAIQHEPKEDTEMVVVIFHVSKITQVAQEKKDEQEGDEGDEKKI
jgi:hypothetical protein